MPPSEFLIEAKEAVNGETERGNAYSKIWERHNETAHYSKNYTEMGGTYNETAHDNDDLVCPTMTSQGTVYKKFSSPELTQLQTTTALKHFFKIS